MRWNIAKTAAEMRGVERMARLARALSHGVASRHAASALKHQTAPLLRPAGASQLSTPACRLHMNSSAARSLTAARATSTSQDAEVWEGEGQEVEEFSELEEGEDLEEGNGGASEEEFDVPEASTSGSHHEGPFIDIDETVWGRKALEAAEKVLQAPEMEGLELYCFRAVAKGSVLDVRLDKLDDKYGSPMLEDIEKFARALYRKMEEGMGEEAAGDITVEASSPGAERKLRIPRELTRFKELPMTVSYHAPGDATKAYSRVFQLSEINEAEESSVWQLANVKMNRPNGKGVKLTKKQAAERFTVPLKDLNDVRLYIEL